MSRTIHRVELWLLAITAAVLPAKALEIKLRVEETRGVARLPAIITGGIPFARGVLRDFSSLTLTTGSSSMPIQTTKTVSWDDGSVRWMLLDTQLNVPARSRVELLLKDVGSPSAPPVRVKVDDAADVVKIDTGPMVALLNKRKVGLIESLQVDGEELLNARGKGLVVVTEDGKEVPATSPSQVSIEQEGPLRAVVCLRGNFGSLHNGLLTYTVRVSAFAGQKFLKFHVWFENNGADGQGEGPPEWFAFDGMAVEFGLALGGAVSARCEDVEAKDSFKVLQLCQKGTKAPFFTFENLEYVISSAGQELKRGARTDGVVELKGEKGILTIACRDFWENYEKAIEMEKSLLLLWLWPPEGQWPRPTKNLNHEQIRRLKGITRDKLYLLPGSVHKGH